MNVATSDTDASADVGLVTVALPPLILIYSALLVQEIVTPFLFVGKVKSLLTVLGKVILAITPLINQRRFLKKFCNKNMLSCSQVRELKFQE